MATSVGCRASTFVSCPSWWSLPTLDYASKALALVHSMFEQGAAADVKNRVTALETAVSALKKAVAPAPVIRLRSNRKFHQMKRPMYQTAPQARSRSG